MTTVRMDVVVHKDFPLFKGETVREATRKLSDSGREFVMRKLNLTQKTAGSYMVEAFSSACVFEVYRRDVDAPYKYYAVSFKRSKEGDFEFGTTMEVERVTSFQPKPNQPTLKSEDGYPGWPVKKDANAFWQDVV
jgi:hypothetical protein